MNYRKLLFFSLAPIIFSFSFFASINLPDSFGKTNFIVGVDPQELINKSGKPASCPTPKTFPEILRPTKQGVKCALFAPNDAICDILINLIKHEKTSIKMAAYLLTEHNVIKELIAAKKRGINVTIIFDPHGINHKLAKVAHSLADSGIEVFVYKPDKLKKESSKLSYIMHHKFIVFDHNVFERGFVWTGSFNFTYSAYKANQENVVIFDDRQLIQAFTKQFDDMQSQLCYRYRGKRTKKKS